MVNTPKQNTQTVQQELKVARRSLDASSWIGQDALRVLQPTAQKWTSPVSGTSISKRQLFGAENRSNTVAIFQTKDLVAAQKLAQKNKPAASAANACKECPSLKKMMREMGRENRRLVDGMMTKGRENYRLREDLRAMLERAQEYKDQADGAMEQVESVEREREHLEDELNNEKVLHELRMDAMKRERAELMDAYNRQLADLKALESKKQALEMDCARLSQLSSGLQREVADRERELDELQDKVDQDEESRQDMNQAFDVLVSEGQKAADQALEFLRRFDAGEI